MILTKGGEASTPLEETSFAFTTWAGNRISVTGFRLTVLQLLCTTTPQKSAPESEVSVVLATRVEDSDW